MWRYVSVDVVLVTVLTEVDDGSAILMIEVDDDGDDEAVVDVTSPSTCWLVRSPARSRKTRRRAMTTCTAEDVSKLCTE
jgi:hypothetical protein